HRAHACRVVACPHRVESAPGTGSIAPWKARRRSTGHRVRSSKTAFVECAIAATSRSAEFAWRQPRVAAAGCIAGRNERSRRCAHTRATNVQRGRLERALARYSDEEKVRISADVRLARARQCGWLEPV